MRLPPKNDPHGDIEGRLPLTDVLTVLKNFGVSVDLESESGCCTLISDNLAEVHFLSDPVGGVMVKYLARKFEIPITEFYFFRQLEAQRERGIMH